MAGCTGTVTPRQSEVTSLACVRVVDTLGPAAAFERAFFLQRREAMQGNCQSRSRNGPLCGAAWAVGSDTATRLRSANAPRDGCVCGVILDNGSVPFLFSDPIARTPFVPPLHLQRHPYPHDAEKRHTPWVRRSANNAVAGRRENKAVTVRRTNKTNERHRSQHSAGRSQDHQQCPSRRSRRQGLPGR